MKGFSSRNLWNMRNFYVTYQADEKLQPMVAEISWTKNLVIMEKCKEDLEREFYIRMTKRYGWTKDMLRVCQINCVSLADYSTHPFFE